MPPRGDGTSAAALVTGASRGIGREIARLLAARGVRVAVGYRRDRTAALAAVASLPGGGHAALRADMSDERAASRLWLAAEAAVGPVSILVNNAGVYEEHPPLSTSPSRWLRAWRRTLDANLVGPAVLSHLAARAMARRGRGRIVNISSRGAFRGEPDAPAYGASKAGLNAMSQSLAKALAPGGVLVFCLAPGWTRTDMAAGHLRGPRGREILAQHPLGRTATAAEVAAVAAYCALDAPAAMTGAVVDVNGASYLRT